MIVLKCQRCAKSLQVKDGLAGKKVKCPGCSEVITVTDTAERLDADTLPPIGELESSATLPPLPNSASGKSTLAQPESADHQNAAVPGYKILGELGRGGMGVVYKAKHLQLNRTVALKMILAGGHAGEAELARFKIEAEAVARLQHPGIVQIHETGVHQGLPYFSLEFVEGGSLDRKLNGTPLPAAVAARLTLLLAQAMHAAHEKDILHRDLKPANVFLMPTRDKNGVLIEDRHGITARYLPKIGDFGLAKKLEGTSDTPGAEAAGAPGVTVSGSIMGTPSYMAPEQAEGKSAELGPAADTYALGAILYDLLTGRPPFRSATPLETLMQVVSNEPVPPTQLNAQIPRDLETICLKCLQKDPKKRYASSQDLGEDLERYLNGEPIRARAVGRVERTWRWCRRNPAVAGLLATVAATLFFGTVVASGLAIWALINAAHARRETARADDEAKTAQDNADLANDNARQAKANADRASDNARVAKENEDKARDETRKALRSLANGDILLAQSAWEHNDAALAHDRLSRVPSEPEQLRGWEWRYLQRQFQGGLFSFVGHADEVTCVAFSPDGTRLATGCADGTARLWDAHTGAAIHECKGHSNRLQRIAFSPDGSRLATCAWDQTARLWDARTGEPLREFKHEGIAISDLAFSPDGTCLLTGDDAAMAHLWDTWTGKPLLELKASRPYIAGIAFSPDGTRIATSGQKSIQTWDPGTGTNRLEIPEPGIYGLAFSPDGSRLAGVSVVEVCLWDARSGTLIRRIKSPTVGVKGVAFSPDGTKLVTGNNAPIAGGDNVVRVWDVATGNQLLELKGHTAGVHDVAFSPDGTHIATASSDHTARLWDARQGLVPRELVGHNTNARSLAFSSDSKRLVTASGLTARLWDRRTASTLHEFKGHTVGISSVAFSPGGKRVATAGHDKTVRLWDAETGAQVREFQQPNLVMDTAFTPDGKQLAVVTLNQSVQLLDADSEKVVVEFKHSHHDPADPQSFNVNRVALNADGTILAGACGDQKVRIWNTQTGAQLREMAGHTQPSTSVAFSPDGTLLASGSVDGTARLWDPGSGASLGVLKGHARQVMAVAFSPDSMRLATASLDNTIRIWDVRTNAPLLELKGHKKGVWAVAFSPDGNYLASAGDDLTPLLWDARNILMDSTKLPDAEERDYRARTTRFDQPWHTQELQAKRQAGDWFAALHHVNQLLRQQPADAGLLQTRRDILVDAVQRDPKDATAAEIRALLLLEGGQLEDYRKATAALATLAADFKDDALTRRLAIMCALAPEALPDLKPLLAAFQKTMGQKFPEDLRIHGGLLLRAGNAEDAVKRLEEARKDAKESPYEDLLLTIGYGQLKKQAEAKACLQRAAAVLDNKERYLAWRTALELQILRREGEKTH